MTGERSSAGRVAGVIGAGVAGLIVLRLVAGGFVFDQVWAEDGRVFLRDATSHGWGSLAYTYSGYAHTLPRLVALIGSLLPLPAFAVFSVVASIVLVALLAAFVYVCMTRLTNGRWALLPALAMALAPAAAQESLGNLANLQWWLVPASFCALALGADVVGGLRVVAVAVSLAAALTSPLAVVALPAAAIGGRRGLLSAQSVALGVGLVIQAALVAFGPTSDLALDRQLQLTRLIPTSFLYGVLGPARGPLFMGAVIGLVVGIGLLVLLAMSRNGRPLALAAALSSVALYLSTSILTGPAPRYQTAALLLLSIGIAAAAADVPRVAPFLTAGACALAVAAFPVTPYRASGPEWSEQATRAEQECDSGSAIGGPLIVSPAGWGPARFTLDC